MNMADYLIDVTKGKTLTEVGSRNGDIIACLTHHKTKVEGLPAPMSVELDREYCEKMKKRGIAVTCESITDLDEDAMPISDFYFWWPMARPQASSQAPSLPSLPSGEQRPHPFLALA